jgi:hypothetical protein
MAWQKAEYKLTGCAPLLMHNGQLADPSNPIVKKIKEITGKRKKTDADIEEIAHLEFLGGLYLDANGPTLAADAIEATIIGGAKKFKEGMVAKSGMFVEDHASLEYDGPREPEELWATEEHRFSKAVRVGQSKVMRMRPVFPKWESTITVSYEDSITNKSRVDDWITTAGQQVGLLEWRPRFGRFDVEVV